MAPRPKITAAFKKKFLKLLSETGNVQKCCQALNVSRVIMYNHKRKDPKFEEGWIKAQDMAIDLLEDEAWRRAFEGVKKQLFYKGSPLQVKDKSGKMVNYVERHYSDTLLMHRLQAERPDKYQYRQKVDANVTGDLTIKVVKFADGNNDSK